MMKKLVIWTGLVLAGVMALAFLTTGAEATEVGKTSFDFYGTGSNAGPDLTGDEVTNSTKAIPVATWHLSYEAWWDSKWSSSFGASQVEPGKFDLPRGRRLSHRELCVLQPDPSSPRESHVRG
jgi:hypothetical protein